jgi:hypothetical protein
VITATIYITKYYSTITQLNDCYLDLSSLCWIERGTKLTGVKLYEHGVPLATILNVLGYFHSTFFRALKLWQEIGDVVPTPGNIYG